MNSFSYSLFAAAICVTTNCAFADPLPTVIEQCPKGYEPAYVDVILDISTSDDCPLLEDKELRKLVNKFGTGTVFAYPAVPRTCVSGSELSGTLTLLKSGQEIVVEGYSESAQRLFAEAEAVGNPLFIEGDTFASGAAMTVVSIQSVEDDGEGLDLDLVLADRFTIDFSVYPFIDTEDFLVIGSKGDRTAAGRLNGLAQIFSFPGQPLLDESLNVSGYICLK